MKKLFSEIITVHFSINFKSKLDQSGLACLSNKQIYCYLEKEQSELVLKGWTFMITSYVYKKTLSYTNGNAFQANF